MQLVLTHENSDFDAVASQMLANKLYPAAQPLLARRVNRNVSRFLTLYWDALNFIRAEDWQRQRVDHVILVDTHSLANVRGIRKATTVQVIDHHLIMPDDEPLPADWNCHIDNTGATATILIERIRESGGQLSEVEATLALLGIYEDSGSLTYDSTTSRDAAAAAWLLSLGANLSVVRRFMEIPLTEMQQLLYRQLQAGSEWLSVQDQTVIIAQALAPADFTDEISSVAHRMRDALVPDILFIVVQIDDNVQVVLRSTTDHLDVGAMARALGGGGHSKAAAALLQATTLAVVTARIKTLLTEMVRPPVAVREVMSWGVETMRAEVTVAQAAETIRRLGHEGYPIVDAENNLVGLLTRRAVDRSISHELADLTVGQVMRAGRVSVTPADSLTHVRQLMIESGWGQIPVVEGTEGGRILGIITRTDLINHLFQPAGTPLATNLRDLMAEMLSDTVWQLVQIISDVAMAKGYPLYFVGGIVRDMLLGSAPNDIDMVVEGDAIALVKALCAQLGGQMRTHKRFGTAKWLLDEGVAMRLNEALPAAELPRALDFVTARSEYYERPSALPEVKEGSIKLDLLRRDFTINALAIRLDGAHLGRLLDYYGGQQDLENGYLRVLHSLSFIDDPTRILRAVRLEQRLSFVIEPRTEELIGAALYVLGRTSGDRIRHELELVLTESCVIAIMWRLDELAVLPQLYEKLFWDERLERGFAAVADYLIAPFWPVELGSNDGLIMRFMLWLLPLDLAHQQEFMEWLHCRRTTRQDVLGAGKLWARLVTLPAVAKPAEIGAILRPYDGRNRVLAACLIHAETSGHMVAADSIRRYQAEWAGIRPELDGVALQNMGVPRGPQLGDLLEQLWAGRVNGQIVSLEEERAYVTAWLANEHR